jgi:hypothetical protein
LGEIPFLGGLGPHRSLAELTKKYQLYHTITGCKPPNTPKKHKKIHVVIISHRSQQIIVHHEKSSKIHKITDGLKKINDIVYPLYIDYMTIYK